VPFVFQRKPTRNNKQGLRDGGTWFCGTQREDNFVFPVIRHSPVFYGACCLIRQARRTTTWRQTFFCGLRVCVQSVSSIFSLELRDANSSTATLSTKNS
jgi:hypothetical protein